jgi:hypothetical protein
MPVLAILLSYLVIRIKVLEVQDFISIAKLISVYNYL